MRQKPCPPFLASPDSVGFAQPFTASVARTVNTTQFVANWLIGREIVEEEQHGCGRRRAGYAENVVLQLAGQLTSVYWRGWSAQNLFYMKQFYATFPGLIAAEKILHAVRGESAVKAILHAPRGKSFAVPVMSTAEWQPRSPLLRRCINCSQRSP